MVHVSKLSDAYVRWNDYDETLEGGGRVWQVGTPLKVAVESVDFDRRLVDFVPVAGRPAAARRPGTAKKSDTAKKPGAAKRAGAAKKSCAGKRGDDHAKTRAGARAGGRRRAR